MSYVIGYKTKNMVNPSIVRGPFSTLKDAFNELPKENIRPYQVYELVSVDASGSLEKGKKVVEVLRELFKG